MASLKWNPQPEWPQDCQNLLFEYKTKKLSPQTADHIIEKSSNFVIRFPTDKVRSKFLQNHMSKDVLERNINSVYPIVHHKALELFCKFILYKRKHGTEIEINLYKTMTLKGFIERLLNKRAASFLGPTDRFLLMNNIHDSGNWETIGKSVEKPPQVLANCLSYDEIKCSVFLNVSSYTYFLNTGTRRNMAKFSKDRSNIEGEKFHIFNCRLNHYIITFYYTGCFQSCLLF